MRDLFLLEKIHLLGGAAPGPRTRAGCIAEDQVENRFPVFGVGNGKITDKTVIVRYARCLKPFFQVLKDGFPDI